MTGEQHQHDPQRTLWRLPRNLFQFTTTGSAELHTAVIQVFAEAHERLLTALSFDDVRAGLERAGWLGAPLLADMAGP
jgi:hypothetical protein